MRSFLELFSVLLLGLTLGGVLSWYSIQNNHGFGALKIGQWTAWPHAGSRDSDPYTKAKVAAEGEVPLGAAEGIAFHARFDSVGDPLKRHCQYRLIGQTPPGRFWTLSAHNLNRGVSLNNNRKPESLISRSLLRQNDGRFVLEVGPELAIGNWLETSGKGSYELILRLYDSPITSTSGIVDPEMPMITQLRCVS